MNRKDFRPNDEYSSSRTSSSYELKPQYDTRKSFYGKARVETGKISGRKKLYSYDTLVAEIDDAGNPIVYNTQSPTTVRHVKEFLKQHGYKAESKGQIEKDYGNDNPYHTTDEQSNAYNENAEQEQYEDEKRQTGLPKDETKSEIIKQGKNKYGILYTFEIGNSGEYEQRIVASNLSRSKAEIEKKKLDNK